LTIELVARRFSALPANLFYTIIAAFIKRNALGVTGEEKKKSPPVPSHESN